MNNLNEPGREGVCQGQRSRRWSHPPGRYEANVSGSSSLPPQCQKPRKFPFLSPGPDLGSVIRAFNNENLFKNQYINTVHLILVLKCAISWEMTSCRAVTAHLLGGQTLKLGGSHLMTLWPARLLMLMICPAIVFSLICLMACWVQRTKPHTFVSKVTLKSFGSPSASLLFYQICQFVFLESSISEKLMEN